MGIYRALFRSWGQTWNGFVVKSVPMELSGTLFRAPIRSIHPQQAGAGTRSIYASLLRRSSNNSPKLLSSQYKDMLKKKTHSLYAPRIDCRFQPIILKQILQKQIQFWIMLSTHLWKWTWLLTTTLIVTNSLIPATTPTIEKSSSVATQGVAKWGSFLVQVLVVVSCPRPSSISCSPRESSISWDLPSQGIARGPSWLETSRSLSPMRCFWAIECAFHRFRCRWEVIPALRDRSRREDLDRPFTIPCMRTSTVGWFWTVGLKLDSNVLMVLILFIYLFFVLFFCL